MSIIEQKRDGYLISTDKSKLNIDVIHQYLSKESYWAQGRPIDTVRKSIEHSLCFGVYAEDRQVGFARVITDYVTFAWLCDVFILPSHQGQNLGKWLVECVSAYPDLARLNLFVLATRNAHELYRRYGSFDALQNTDRWMVRVVNE